MVLVVAVMVIGTLLLTESVRSVLNERRALPRKFEQQQARHILQDGISRLRTLPSFESVREGEWNFPKGVIHSDHSASLEVRVGDGEAIVTARYPLESETPVTLSQTLTTKDWEQ